MHPHFQASEVLAEYLWLVVYPTVCLSVELPVANGSQLPQPLRNLHVQFVIKSRHLAASAARLRTSDQNNITRPL